MATRAILSKLSSSPLLHSRLFSASRLRPLLLPIEQVVLFKRPSITGHQRSMSTNQTYSSVRDSNPNFSNRPPKETILLDGCDFEHWLVVMDPPPGDAANPDITRDEIIDSYVKTLAQIVGSEEEARMKIYSVSTRHYFAFGALVSEDLSYKIKELPHVRWVLPDSYLDVRNKDYGGEPFINGEAVPYDPKYHEEWVRNNARANERSRRNDRPRNFDRSRNFERRREQNYQNAPPPQNNFQNAPPPQTNFQNSSPPPSPPNYQNAPPPPPNYQNTPPRDMPNYQNAPPREMPYPNQGGFDRRPVYQGGPGPQGPGPYQGGGFQGGPGPNVNNGPGPYQGGGAPNQYQGGPPPRMGGPGVNYEHSGPGAGGPPSRMGGPGVNYEHGGPGAGGAPPRMGGPGVNYEHGGPGAGGAPPRMGGPGVNYEHGGPGAGGPPRMGGPGVGGPPPMGGPGVGGPGVNYDHGGPGVYGGNGGPGAYQGREIPGRDYQ